MPSLHFLRSPSRVASALLISALSFNSASAVIVFTDGFGDGDRDNNGLDSGASVTDSSDVGIPWYFTDGTSAATFKAVDDSAGIGSGNALQLFNSGSNNRPTVGNFAPLTLANGEKLILRFDARMVSTSANADRAIRFGLYRDTNGNNGTGDRGSGGVLSTDDVGYNARVDAGADTSNTTSMDVTRDDSATGTSIIQATTTGIGVSSTNATNQFSDALKHHFELSLLRSGTSLVISLQKDSNSPITGTDATPVGFAFDEVALGVRSNAAIDMRFDNIQVEYVSVPEATAFSLVTLVAASAISVVGSRRLRAA